jgi:hypothetical protein
LSLPKTPNVLALNLGRIGLHPDHASEPSRNRQSVGQRRCAVTGPMRPCSSVGISTPEAVPIATPINTSLVQCLSAAIRKIEVVAASGSPTAQITHALR